MEDRIEDPSRTLFLDNVTDIYVGKHSKDYSVEAVCLCFCSFLHLSQSASVCVTQASDRCFSIVARSKNIWLDLEAKTSKLRDAWVCAILLLLKNRVAVKVHREDR